MIAAGEQSGGKSKRGNGGKKADAHTVQDRIEFTATLLAQGQDSRQIRRALQKEFKILGRQSAEYVARAREWMLQKASGMSKQQALAEAIQFYRSMIADRKTGRRDKILCRVRLDNIFGLDAPKARWQPELPPPVNPAEEMARSLDSGMLSALELVYGKDARQQVIDIATKSLPPAPAPQATETQKPRLKLA